LTRIKGHNLIMHLTIWPVQNRILLIKQLFTDVRTK